MMLALESQTTACHACGHGLGAEALFCPNCGTAKKRDLDEDPLIGARVGERYLLIEQIGQGTSGTIYRGEHVTLRRRVCVKVLHHELSRDDLAIERFRRQATTVSDLENEHIVAVHDFGRAPDGRLYIAMEYLEGETLSDRIAASGRLEVDEAVSVLIQLGEALIEAHAIGYVHRDLRPRNLFLAVRRGSANFLKLLDFGLSKLVASEGSADSTSLGMTFGDPHYMSPEQARGEPVDRRADIYSMGCIAYQMFTGEPPFSGEKVFDVLSRHVEEEPVPLSQKAQVPAWINAAVMRCLAKNPDDRFATVFRLVEALREGAASGTVMDAARAQRRETTQPASVSRIMERFSDRLGADGRMDDADDQRSLMAGASTDSAKSPLPALPAKKKPFDGSTTALGVGVGDLPQTLLPVPGNLGGIVAPVDVAPTEPTTAPAAISSDDATAAAGETGGDAVPSHIVTEPTPPPRSRETPAVVVRPPSSPVSMPAAVEPSSPASNLAATTVIPPKATPVDPGASYEDDDEYEYDDDDEVAAPEVAASASSSASKRAASGKRAKISNAGDSGLGISSAWYADGEALGDSNLDLDDEDLAKLAKARSRGSRAGLSATGEMYYDPEPSRLKWVVAAIGGAALLGLTIFLFTRGGDEAATDEAKEKPVEVAGNTAGSDTTPTTAATVDAGAVIAADAPALTAVKPTDIKPKDVKPKDVKPKDVKPKDVKPKDVKPKDVKPKDALPKDTLPKDTLPKDPDEKKRPSEEDKKRANFFAQIGKKALARGDIPGAAKEFRRALALNPSNSRAITGLGEIALKQGSYASAVRHLSRAAKMRSGSAYVQSLLGDAKLGTGDKSGATSAYRRALQIDPDNARAKRGLERLGISG